MTSEEYARIRLERWRLRPDLAPNDEHEIRDFIKEAGLCYTYHIPRYTIPSLIQTISGSVTPSEQYSYMPDNPFHEMLNSTFRVFYKKKLFVEVGVFGKHPVIVYRDVFARLYRIIGTEVRGGYLTKRRRNTNLETAIISFMNEKGPVTRRELRISLLSKKKDTAVVLTKALESLGRRLKVIRIRQAGDNGLMWLTPEKWNPRLCTEAAQLERSEAIEYLILRFLNISVATSRRALKRFFNYIIPSDVTDLTLNSLIQRGLIKVDPDLIIDGKKALKSR
jgi:hypothetical protein